MPRLYDPRQGPDGAAVALTAAAVVLLLALLCSAIGGGCVCDANGTTPARTQEGNVGK